MTIDIAEYAKLAAPDLFEKFQSEHAKNNPLIHNLFCMQETGMLNKGQFMPLMLLVLAESNDNLTRELRTAVMLQHPNSPAVPVKAQLEAFEEIGNMFESGKDWAEISTAVALRKADLKGLLFRMRAPT